MEYLLKSAAIVTLFYVCYKLFLDKETYFTSNRFFLIVGLLLSFIIPLIVIPIYVIEEPVALEFVSTSQSVQESPSVQPFNYLELAAYLYLAGISVLIFKSLVEFASLKNVLNSCSKLKDGNYTFLETSQKISPFSFFNIIVYNPNMFDKSELKHVIAHEKAHARQWHSLDVMLAQSACILLWFNPFVWLYKKELQQNLEFIADHTAQGQSECSRTYQHLLLKTSLPYNQMALANHFYNSLIKKRIVMLHKNPSNKRNQWKLLLVLPLLTAFMFTFNTKVVAQNKDKKKNVSLENVDVKMVQFAISKDSDGKDLEEVKGKLKDHGVSATFKKIKRNSDDEITAISINASGKKSNANFSIDNETPISTIMIRYNKTEDKLSIGNGKDIHFAHGKNIAFTSKDGEDVIVEIDGDASKNGAYVFTTSDDKNHTVKNNVKVIELIDNDEIIELKESTDNVFAVRVDTDSDNDVEEDVKVIVRTSSDGGNIHLTETDDDEIEVLSPGKNKIFISRTDSDPLIFINDKESTKDEMEKLDPENIDRMEVHKGDDAIEKYGDKAKDGVIKIYTKKH